MNIPAPPDPDPDGRNAFVYSYKPSLMGAAFAFRLAPTGLEWSRGRHAGHLPYAGIRRLRLSFRPVTMQPQRFIAEIWPMSGPKLQIASVSWRSMVEQERQDLAYRAFVLELHRRIAEAGGQAAFEAGSPAALYWIGLVVFTVVSLAIAALAVRALQFGQATAAAIVVGFLALFLWQIGGFFRRNRPGRYGPDAIPSAVLP